MNQLHLDKQYISFEGDLGIEFSEARYTEGDLRLLAHCIETNGGSLSRGLAVFQSVRAPVISDNEIVHMWLGFAESIQKDSNFVNDHFDKAYAAVPSHLIARPSPTEFAEQETDISLEKQ